MIQASDNTPVVNTGTQNLPKVPATVTPVTPQPPVVPPVAATSAYTTGGSGSTGAATPQVNATAAPTQAPNTPVMDPLAFSTQPSGATVSANVAGTGGSTMPAPSTGKQFTEQGSDGTYYANVSDPSLLQSLGYTTSALDSMTADQRIAARQAIEARLQQLGQIHWDNQGATQSHWGGLGTELLGDIDPETLAVWNRLNTPEQASDFANGVQAYGRTWAAGTAPPPGLSDAQLSAWQQSNPNSVGWAPWVWQMRQDLAAPNARYKELQQKLQAGGTFTPEEEADWGRVSGQMTDISNSYTSNNSPVASLIQPQAPQAPRYLQGGQYFDNLDQANAAMAASKAQMDAGGSGILSTLFPGGTYGPGVEDQITGGLTGGTLTNPKLVQPGGANDVNPGGQLPLGGGSTLPVQPPATGGGGTTGGGAPYQPPTQTTGGGSTTGGGGTTTVPGGGPNTPTSPDLNPGIKPLDPATDLRNFEITPGDLVDRFKLATQQFGTFADSTQSHYDAALRDANRAAAATGRLGSGMLRTSYGDLANERANSLTTERDSLFQNALLGSVQDAQQKYNDYLAEQAFEQGAQNTAYQQQIQGLTLQDQLTGTAFQRALQQLTAGGSGNPADMQMLMSQLTGQSASSALQALTQLIASQNAANGAAKGAAGTTTGGSNTGLITSFLDWMKNLGKTGNSVGGVDSPVGGDYGNTAIA